MDLKNWISPLSLSHYFEAQLTEFKILNLIADGTLVLSKEVKGCYIFKILIWINTTISGEKFLHPFLGSQTIGLKDHFIEILIFENVTTWTGN